MPKLIERFVITANIKRLRKMLGEPVGKLDEEHERQARKVLAEEEAKLSELDKREGLPLSQASTRSNADGSL